MSNSNGNVRMRANVMIFLRDNLFNGQTPATVDRKTLDTFFKDNTGIVGPLGSEIYFPAWLTKNRVARENGRGTQRGVYALDWTIIDQWEQKNAEKSASTGQTV